MCRYQRADNYGVPLYIYFHNLFDSNRLIINKLFHFRLSKLTASGSLARIRKSWWGPEKSCAMNSNFENCGFDQTVSAFVVWFSGLFLGVCFLLGEMVRNSRKHRKKTYR